MKQKATRNRSRKPVWTYQGATILLWQSIPENIVWAQQSQQFRDLMTILINERSRALNGAPSLTENRQLGRIEGYEEAIKVIRQLAEGTPTEDRIAEEATYAADTTTTDQDFD